VPVGEPIAAVNWRKGDAAQQRKIENPRVSTAMEFLVGTGGSRDSGQAQRDRNAARLRRGAAHHDPVPPLSHCGLLSLRKRLPK